MIEDSSLIDAVHTMEQIAVVYGASAIAIMAFFTAKAYQSVKKTVKLIKLQSQPWVGPVDEEILSDPNSIPNKEKFLIKLKNFGELQSKNTIVHFLKKDHAITKDDIKNANEDKSNLGTILPNMGTNYWFYIDLDEMEKVRNNTSQVFVGLYISYESTEGKNGYGLISYWDSTTKQFVKTEMWED